MVKAGTVSLIGHGRFIPNHFHFTIHQYPAVGGYIVWLLIVSLK
jgi:hypothetical protein